MAFIDRDGNGKIRSLYACRQRAGQEELPDNHAEVVAFRDQPMPKPRDLAAEFDALAARVAALEAQGGGAGGTAAVRTRRTK